MIPHKDCLDGSKPLEIAACVEHRQAAAYRRPQLVRGTSTLRESKSFTCIRTGKTQYRRRMNPKHVADAVAQGPIAVIGLCGQAFRQRRHGTSRGHMSASSLQMHREIISLEHVWILGGRSGQCANV
jgi:hypothetical protein